MTTRTGHSLFDQIQEVGKRRDMMDEPLTAVFEKSPHGYIGYIEEFPGVNTQGETLEETRKHLIEALELVLQTNRELAEEEVISNHRDIVKEPLGRIAV